MMKFVLSAAVLCLSVSASAETSDFERGFESAKQLCQPTIVKCRWGSLEASGQTEKLAKNAAQLKCLNNANMNAEFCAKVQTAPNVVCLEVPNQ